MLSSSSLAAGAGRVDAQEVVEYYATDAVGSIRVVFAPDGTVKARSDYLPFGEEWQSATPGGPLPSQRFTGQQRDSEENLDYFNARSLQTRTGRFIRVDPVFSGLSNPQRWNRYSYALNSPLKFTDPSGLIPIERRDPPGPGGGDGDGGFGGWPSPGHGGNGPCYPACDFPTDPLPNPSWPAPPKEDDPTEEEEPSEPEQTVTVDPCKTVPQPPPTANLNDNIRVAVSHNKTTWITSSNPRVGTYPAPDGGGSWFYNRVRNARGRAGDVQSNKSWDYKQLGPQYEAFGNFNYGATGVAVGIDPVGLKAGSFYAHVMSHGVGDAFADVNLSNEFADQAQIDAGIAYFESNCHDKKKK
jgi:RHS repeat-associated protein